jgi:hypothetical protein
MENSKDEDDYTRELTNWNYLVSTFDNDAAFEASTSPTVSGSQPQDASSGKNVDLDQKPPPRAVPESAGILLLSDSSASHGPRALSASASYSGAEPSHVQFAMGGMTRSVVGVPSTHTTGDIWHADTTSRMPFQARPISDPIPGAAGGVSSSPMWNPAGNQMQQFSPTRP